jgi:antirestriction protein ArdC
VSDTPKRDYRQEVTNDIIRLLEQGVAPWQKPWTAQHSISIPFNPTTSKPYRGGNILVLTVAAMRRGYDDPRWATYRQASNEGWQVRRGEKGTQIEFWDVKPARKETEEGRDQPDSRESQRLIHRVYTVFNAQQMDGSPPIHVQRPTGFEVVEAGENILKNSGVQIFHDQADRAFYNRRFDTIHLPPKSAFQHAEPYYGTACHELIHATGHESRLNRETLNKSRGFSTSDESYSREELVAEIGSMMLAAEKGIPHDPEQHAAYVGSWIAALRNDKNEIFRAASGASAATDYILDRDRNRAIETVEIERTPVLVGEEVRERLPARASRQCLLVASWRNTTIVLRVIDSISLRTSLADA